jgi:predicted Ser/Thr protein kinase
MPAVGSEPALDTRAPRALLSQQTPVATAGAAEAPRSSVRTAHGSGVLDNRYRLIGRVGEGGMGVVYRAEDLGLGRTVAVKVIDPTRAGDRSAIERFKTEARVLAEIRHDNVVQVHAFGRHAPFFYLAMEFVPGPNLDELIEEHAARGECIDLDEAIWILRHVADGLAAVHARGVVHRDVKPSNILIEATTGRPVLIDFGLARRSSKPRGKESIVGTPAYMAPEQTLAEDVELSCRADIYALACTAFELLTGNLPFGGEDPVEIVRAHVQDEAPLVSAFQPDRAAFDGVIARGMAKNPLERYESCSAFVADLDLALANCRSRPVTSRPPFAPQRVLRVIVLAHDEALRGQLGRIVDRALTPLAVCAAIESVPTPIALAGAIARSRVDVVVLDDDSVSELQGNIQSPHALREFVAEVRRTGAEVVVLQRDVAECPLRFAELGVHVVPKPISARLVESMIARLASDQRRTIE